MEVLLGRHYGPRTTQRLGGGCPGGGVGTREKMECLQATDKPPTKPRWVDISKGNEVHPESRSRSVAKEIKIDNRPAMSTATSPLEFIKYLISR